MTRRRVLDAADEVFAERGFHAARVEEIAERAGYTRGAVYSNFDDKGDLALAIIEHRVDAAIALLQESVGAKTSALRAAEAAGPRFMQLLLGEPSWAPLFLEFVTHAGRHPELRSRLTALYGVLAASIASLLDQVATVSGGELRVSTERLARMMLAATDGVALQRLIDPESTDDGLLGEMFGAIIAGTVARERA